MVAALAFVTFLPSVTGPPFWDDLRLLAASYALGSWTDAFSFQSFGLHDGGAGAQFWRPLVTLGFWLERRVSSEATARLVHHTISLALHAGVAALAFRWLRRMTTGAPPIWLTALAAAVWATLPLKAENVAWISGRGDVAGALFLLVGLEVVHHASRRWQRIIAALLSTAAALLCKESFVVAPVFFALETSGWKRAPGRVLVPPLRSPEFWAACVVVAFYLALRTSGGGIAGGGSMMFARLGLLDRVVMVFESFGWAIVSMLTPLRTQLLRGPWGFDANGALTAQPVVSVVGLVALLWLGVLLLRVPRARLGLLALTLPLLPVLNIVPTGLESRMSDRYLYLPSLGLLLLLLELACFTARRFPRTLALRASGAAFGALLVAAVVSSVQRARLFADPNELWLEEASKSSPAPSVLVHASRALEADGSWLKARNMRVRTAKRYAELGFAEGLPHVVAAARLNYQAFGESVPKAVQAYAACLRCLLEPHQPAAAVPFPDREGEGVRVPCLGVEAEQLRRQRADSLRAQLLVLQARRGRDVSPALRSLGASCRDCPRTHRYLAWAWLALARPDEAEKALNGARLPERERFGIKLLAESMKNADSPAIRLFLGAAYGPACRKGRSGAPCSHPSIDAACALATPRHSRDAGTSHRELDSLRHRPQARVHLAR